jgi:hypothetical protein
MEFFMEKSTKQEPKRIIVNKKTVEALLLRTSLKVGLLSDDGGGGGPGTGGGPRPMPMPKIPAPKAF